MNEAIRWAITELGGIGKPSAIAGKALQCRVNTLSYNDLKAEIWNLVDRRELIWTASRDIQLGEAKRD